MAASPKPIDPLKGRIGTRTYFIHCVLILATEPLDATEIGLRAEKLARMTRHRFNANTFSGKVTFNHLSKMYKRKFARLAEPGRWVLTDLALDLVARSRPAEVKTAN